LLIAIGVKKKEDIDKAAYAHGKILHSATIATINLGTASSFGTINFASHTGSYSEIVADMIERLGEKLFSKAIATALLTGIVIETGQFSNSKTTPATMSMASKLLASGADQQLIVKEISSGGTVAEAEPDVTLGIPLEEPVAEAEPVADPLAEFMPPPLPDFSANEPEKFTMPLPAPPETTIKAQDAVVPTTNDPAQFKIPV